MAARQGNDKGNVEGLVGCTVTSWCRSRVRDLGGVQPPGWRSNAAKRQHDVLRGESEAIGERLQRDLAAMRPTAAWPDFAPPLTATEPL